MTDWLERIGRIAALGEKIAVLTDGVRTLLAKMDDHERRLTRVETIIEIARPDGVTLRISREK